MRMIDLCQGRLLPPSQPFLSAAEELVFITDRLSVRSESAEKLRLNPTAMHLHRSTSLRDKNLKLRRSEGGAPSMSFIQAMQGISSLAFQVSFPMQL